MNLKERFKVVEVEWIDPYSELRWTELEDALKMKPEKCFTVGHLLKEDKEVVVVALSISEDNEKKIEVSDVLVLPKSIVKNVKVIKKGGVK